MRHLLVLIVAVVCLSGCGPSASTAPSAPPVSAAPSSAAPSSAPSPTASPGAPATADPGSGAPPVLGEPIGGIACDLGGHDGSYHVHSLLRVAVDGGETVPPANVGITDTCLYWVHTHAADGVIHVEAPQAVQPTLGDFLAIWGVTYPDDPVLAAALAAADAGSVTVDGATPAVGVGGFDGDPRSLILGDRNVFVLGP